MLALSHRECVKLVGSPERSREGLFSIEGRAPVLLVCLLLDCGDFLVSAQRDQSLVREATGRPVSVEFTHRDRTGQRGWIVTGTGLARPMRGLDRPDPLPYSSVHSKRDTWERGLRVYVARMSGWRITDDAPVVPRQRTVDESPNRELHQHGG